MADADVMRSLGRMEGKVDMLIERFDKLDDRAMHIERKQWYHTGGLAVAGAILLPKLKTLVGL
jgi:hypothetical protein